MVVLRLRLLGAICAASLVSCTFAITNSKAADGPNQLTQSDFSAGQLVDSLFEPELPTSLTRDVSPRRKTTQRRAALRGKLVDNPNYRDGAPPYALVNREGQVLRYVRPVEDIDLEVYRGETVAVRRDTGRILLASQLALPKYAPLEVAELAAFDEPTPAEPELAEEVAGESEGEESVLTSDSDQGPAIYDEGPTYDESPIESYDSVIDFGGCSECSDGSCQSCSGGCAMPSRGVMYAHGEYLMWWFKGMDTPPLVVARDIPFNQVNGNVPSTTIYGDSPILEDVRYGGRLTLGLWLDECGTWGLEGDYLGLGTVDEIFTAGVKDNNEFGVTIHIGRPYFNTAAFLNKLNSQVNRGKAVELVDTNGLDGTVTVTSQSEFQTAGIRLRHGLCFAPGCCDPGCGDQVGCGSAVNCGSGCGASVLGGPLGRISRLLKCGNRRADILYGIRWASLEESLGINEDLIVPPTSLGGPSGPAFVVDDLFATSNDFYGGEVGFMTEWQRSRWSLGFLSKVAIGTTRQQVDIQGSTTITDANGGASNLHSGGLLTQYYEHPGSDGNIATKSDNFIVGNIGSYERDQFSMIPEIGATLGYQITPRLKLTAGYTLLYWSNVVRPGDQIDIDVNGNLIPSSQVDPVVKANNVVSFDHPRFEFRQTDLWAQGINFGGEYRW